jgi:hypothetical protein
MVNDPATVLSPYRTVRAPLTRPCQKNPTNYDGEQLVPGWIEYRPALHACGSATSRQIVITATSQQSAHCHSDRFQSVR